MFFEFAKEDNGCKSEEEGGESGEESIEHVCDKHQAHVDGRDDSRDSCREKAHRKEDAEGKADDGAEDFPCMAEGDLFTSFERLTIRRSFTDDHNGIKNRADSINDSGDDEEESPEDGKTCSQNPGEEERQNIPTRLSRDCAEGCAIATGAACKEALANDEDARSTPDDKEREDEHEDDTEDRDRRQVHHRKSVFCKRKSTCFRINDVCHDIAPDRGKDNQPEHHGIERRLMPIEVPCGAD